MSNGLLISRWQSVDTYVTVEKIKSRGKIGKTTEKNTVNITIDKKADKTEW